MKKQEAEDEDLSPESEFKKPKDWRERKAQRQKYWSQSQGFRFGRKLGEWGEEPPARPLSGHTGSKDGDEDVEMQEAIRRSLMDTPGALEGIGAQLILSTPVLKSAISVGALPCQF